MEDVFQNTIIKVYENIGSLRKEEYFETWVTSIFLNECRKILRVKKREYITEEVPIEKEEIVRNIDFYDELNSINEIYKEVLILKYIVGYSENEISSIMDIPIGTVKSRTYRGLKMLRERIEEGES